MHEDDDMPGPTSNKDIVVGEDLTALSVNDLKRRLQALTAEMSRVENVIKQKQSQAAAAETLFKSDTNESSH